MEKYVKLNKISSKLKFVIFFQILSLLDGINSTCNEITLTPESQVYSQKF